MRKSVMSILFVFTPIIYSIFIWLQSSRFNPEDFFSATQQIDRSLFLLIGICLELAHLFEFGLLYFFLILAFLHFGKLTWKIELAAFTIAFLYGVLDEIHQMHVPFRSASMGDLIKNTIGIIFILWVVHKSYFSNDSSRFGRFLKKLG